MFVRHGHLRWKRLKLMTTLHIKLFITKTNHSYDNPLSWDMDGIPFIVDNSSTGIVRNVRKLCVVPLIPTIVTLETSEGYNTPKTYVGAMDLFLIDNVNKHHTYDIP